MIDTNISKLYIDIISLSDWEKASEELMEWLKKVTSDKKVYRNIMMALEEVIANIFSYNESVLASIIAEASAQSVRFEIVDNGIPFDPTMAANPSVAEEDVRKRVGGLGIYMVKNLMDSVEYIYRDNKNILTLEKSIP